MSNMIEIAVNETSEDEKGFQSSRLTALIRVNADTYEINVVNPVGDETLSILEYVVKSHRDRNNQTRQKLGLPINPPEA